MTDQEMREIAEDLSQAIEPAPLCNCVLPEPVQDGEEPPAGLTIAHCKTCWGVI